MISTDDKERCDTDVLTGIGSCRHAGQRQEHDAVLLTCADFLGTLAAARCHGQKAIPVRMAGSHFLAPSMWSKYVDRRLRAPAIEDSHAFVQWLIVIGRREPGMILYPTSDGMAWLLSQHRDVLSSYFRMYSPPFDCIRRLLNKQLLYETSADLGISIPETMFPTCQLCLRDLSRSLSFPVLIKPKTQVFSRYHSKGTIIHAQEDLEGAYARFRDENGYGVGMREADESLDWPMIQAYYPEAMESIYGLAGFIDQSGDLVTARASRKVLQQPRRAGVGVCFEEAEVLDELLQKVLSLCRATGYYGVFEVEFIQQQKGGQYLLTDFNPRYYNQMGFDIALGMPLPDLIYHAATKNEEALWAAVRASNECSTVRNRAFCYRMMFSLILNLQGASGQLSTNAVRKWRKWFEEHRSEMTYALAAPDDKVPSIVNALTVLWGLVRHPRSMARLILNQ